MHAVVLGAAFVIVALAVFAVVVLRFALGAYAAARYWKTEATAARVREHVRGRAGGR